MTKQEIKSYAQRLAKDAIHGDFARAVIKLLGGQPKEPPHPMHQQAVTHWKTFLKSHGIPMVMDARHGKQLKEILNNLEGLAKNQSPEGALAAFAYILEKYNLLNDWHQQNKTLNNLNKNLQEILAQIKNGTTKTSTGHRLNTQQRATERGAAADLARRILLQGTPPHRDGRPTDGE